MVLMSQRLVEEKRDSSSLKSQNAFGSLPHPFEILFAAR
jgi:hypothetical protein